MLLRPARSAGSRGIDWSLLGGEPNPTTEIERPFSPPSTLKILHRGRRTPGKCLHQSRLIPHRFPSGPAPLKSSGRQASKVLEREQGWIAGGATECGLMRRWQTRMLRDRREKAACWAYPRGTYPSDIADAASHSAARPSSSTQRCT